MAAMTETGDNRDDARAVLFTAASVSDDELMARQRITAPQGLESLADLDWDDERDDPSPRAARQVNPRASSRHDTRRSIARSRGCR